MERKRKVALVGSVALLAVGAYAASQLIGGNSEPSASPATPEEKVAAIATNTIQIVATSESTPEICPAELVIARGSTYWVEGGFKGRLIQTSYSQKGTRRETHLVGGEAKDFKWRNQSIQLCELQERFNGVRAFVAAGSWNK